MTFSSLLLLLLNHKAIILFEDPFLFGFHIFIRHAQTISPFWRVASYPRDFVHLRNGVSAFVLSSGRGPTRGHGKFVEGPGSPFGHALD